MNAERLRGTYVFGITTPEAVLPAEGVPAMPGGGPIRGLAREGLQAVVREVDVATYGRLEAPTEDDLEVLAAAARSHDALLAAVAASAPVLPLRFGTIVSDDEAVLALLDRHRSALAEELERIRGTAEWNVQAHAPREPAGTGASSGGWSSGADYLRARRAALSAREARWQARDGIANDVHQRLADVAVDSERLPKGRSPDGATPVLHAVYLVADRDVGRFVAVVDQLRIECATEIDVTGPWPPYHFTSVDLGEARA